MYMTGRSVNRIGLLPEFLSGMQTGSWNRYVLPLVGHAVFVFGNAYRCLHLLQTLAPVLPESCSLRAASLGAQDSGRESLGDAADMTIASSADIQQQGGCSSSSSIQPPAVFWCDDEVSDERGHDLQGPTYAACVAMIRCASAGVRPGCTHGIPALCTW